MSNDVNKFLKIRKSLENDLSNKVKAATGNDLFDWLNLILFIAVLIGIVIAFTCSLLNFTELVTGFILWYTAFVVMRYTKETHWIKKIAQKQLNSETDEKK